MQGEYPNIWGHPYIWVLSKHTGDIQIDGGVQTYRVASKHGGCPNMAVSKHAVLHTTQRKHALSSKHTGGFPNILGHPTYGVCPNIWGTQTYVGVSKNMGHPNIWGCLNVWEASKHGGNQTYGGGLQKYGAS